MDKFVNSNDDVAEQEPRSYKSACRMCHGGCGVLILEWFTFSMGGGFRKRKIVPIMGFGDRMLIR